MSNARKVAVVMARLRRLVSPNEAWLLGLRAVLRRIQRDGSVALVGEKTAGSDFIRRGCERLDIACMSICVDGESDVVDGNLPPIPQSDRAVISSAETVFVLGLRPEGNQHRLLRERLQATRGNIYLIDLPNLQPAIVKEELIRLGAQLWVPLSADCEPFASESAAEQGSSTQAGHLIPERRVVQIEPLPLPAESEWLFHTTRSCPGPWPESTLPHYLDSLFDGSEDADHSAFGALKRIVRNRRLISSDHAIRGKFRVVSWSACSLEELCGRHRYQRHRMRWDFEPYGIGIRRRYLEAHGARPVVYGDDELWEALPEPERPFFQATSTENDWSSEREWRHLGDVCLESISEGDAILIVPTYDDAKALAVETNWPITLWPRIGNC